MAQRVGPYEVVRRIGHGGMAVVYLARQPALARNVALKELSVLGVDHESAAQRFLREARLAGSLSHPNVVTVFDFLEQDGTPYIAMEYLERGSLRPSVGRLTLAQAVGVLEALLAALSHAEAMGVVHRDIKPENLLVTADAAVKIGDFGIAKAYDQVATEEMLTPAGATVGTPAYMAPEQAMAQAIGPWTDLYQTGVVAYELFAGEPPFSTTGGPLAVMMKHISDPVPPLPEGRDPALDQWVRQMLAKDPSDRPANAREAWNALEEITVATLGPLWRRDARLGEPDPTVEPPAPLTPARFSSWQDHVPPERVRRQAPPPPTTPPPSAPNAGSDRVPPRAEPPPAEAPATPPPDEPSATPPPDEPPTGAPGSPTSSATLPPSQPERPRRRRTPLVLAGVLGLVAAVDAVSLFTRGDDEPPVDTATATATATASPTVAAGPFPIGDGPDGIAVGAGAVWVAASGAGTLTRIDPTSGETQTVEVGDNPDAVLVALGEVWVSLTGEDKVARVTAEEDPRLLGKVAVGSRPEGLAASDRAVWVANSGDGTVTQIIADTRETRTVEGVGSTPVDVAIGAGAVWVADSAGGVVRVHGGRRVPVRTLSGIGPNPRSLAIVGRDVWVVTADDGRAWRIDADANAVRDSVSVGGQPRDVATDGEHLWVTDRERGFVVEIDAASRRVVGREEVAGGPLEVAVDERAVWVSGFDSGEVTRLPR